jgi:hypothetical protein
MSYLVSPKLAVALERCKFSNNILQSAWVMNGNWELVRDGDNWLAKNEYGHTVNTFPIQEEDDYLIECHGDENIGIVFAMDNKHLAKRHWPNSPIKNEIK